MNHESVSSWSQAAHNGPIIATSGDEDFSNFLELGLDFPHFDSIQDAQPGVDTPMGDLGMDQLGMDGSVGEMEPLNLQHNAMTSQPMSMAAAQARVKNPEMLDPSLHAQILRQHGQVIHGQTYQPQIMFPLTPHSSEMRGAAARFQHHADPQRGLMYDPNQMSFTPLVSPAYSAADYSANGEYFSPLTSPLLEAHQHVVYTSAPHSETGSTTSPVDLNAEYSNNTAPPTPAVRRNGRKPSTSSRAHPRSAKQSPVARGMSRRTQSSISEGAGLVQDSLRQIDGNIARRNTRNNVASTDGSGQDSVSPESLSDVLMPPPAIPRSAGRSPNITAQCKSPSNSGEPATPATLMRLEKELPKGPLSGDPTTSQPSAESGDHMEDIMLPESVASMRPTLEIDTDRPTEDDHDTPTTAAKTPKLVAGSTPRTTMMSPEILSPRNANAQKQPESKPSSRASKKRQSNSSAQISPALMPRISPSIKPLMPTSGKIVAMFLNASSPSQAPAALIFLPTRQRCTSPPSPTTRTF